MAHIPDINDFIKGLKIILKPKGKATIEVLYFLDWLKILNLIQFIMNMFTILL